MRMSKLSTKLLSFQKNFAIVVSFLDKCKCTKLENEKEIILRADRLITKER